jgi:hypothetical protein
MFRITGPQVEEDANGVGRDGFRDQAPGPIYGTHVVAAWLNDVQEEISRAVERNGLALNASDQEQLADVLDLKANLAGGNTFTGTQTVTTLVLTAGRVYRADVATSNTIPEIQIGAERGDQQHFSVSNSIAAAGTEDVLVFQFQGAAGLRAVIDVSLCWYDEAADTLVSSRRYFGLALYNGTTVTNFAISQIHSEETGGGVADDAIVIAASGSTGAIRLTNHGGGLRTFRVFGHYTITTVEL